MRIHKSLALTMLVATVLLVISYGGTVFVKPAESKEPDEIIRIGLTLTSDAIPAMVAIEKGFFRAEGVTPLVSEYDYGAIGFKNLIDGHVDLAMLAESPLVIERFKSKDFSVIANISSTYQSRRIIGLTDKGIHAITDLKGKRIGVLRNTSAHYFLSALLLENNISLDDVNLVFIKDDESPAALKEGRVDAIAAFEPYPSMIIAQWPADALWVTDGDRRIRTAFSYVMKDAYVNAHPETVKKVLLATGKAIAWMASHRDEAIAISAKRMKIPPQIMEKIYARYNFQISLDEVYLLGMSQQAQWYLDTISDGKKFTVPNYVDMINPKPLEAVYPKSVNYVH